MINYNAIYSIIIFDDIMKDFDARDCGFGTGITNKHYKNP
jgi:hypothetical protein